MKLVMTLLLRDEADIVAQNLDFHLEQGVDHVVAVDNGSIDGTREILEDYRSRGLVSIVDELGRGFDQDLWMTRAAQVARDAHGADWILHNDADEFWMSPTGDLKAELAETPANVLHCPRWHMIFGWDGDCAGPWHERCRYRVARAVPAQPPDDIHADDLPVPYFYMDLPPKILTRAEGLVSVTQGNHAATFEGRVVTAPSDITIYHYPVRTAAQLQRKIQAGGAAYGRNRRLPHRVGWHWRRWYRMLEQKGIGAVLDDALPDRARLLADLAAGTVVEDRAMLDWLARAGDRAPPRQAAG